MDRTHSISFVALPVWRGVQISPRFTTTPFSISSKKEIIRQSSPRNLLKKIISEYSDERYEFITSPPGSSQWGNRLGDTYIEFAKTVIDKVSGKKILDIGAGSTYVAEYFTRKAGVATYTIVDPAVSKKMVNGKKINLVHEYFTGNLFKEKYDVVISFNALEHVLDPKKFLLDIQTVLNAPNGKVVLIFPTIERQFQVGDFNALLHEHISYFTIQTAVQLFTACGFAVIHMSEDEDTLFFLLESQSRRIFLDRKEEKDDLLLTAKKSFARNLKRTKQILLRDVSLGRRIAFHGACNGLNNFLFLSKIPLDDRFFLFDGDDTKVRKFLPVLKKPILNPFDPRYKMCDVVYIAALTYFDEIRSFLQRKVRFPRERIFPLYPL